MENNLVRINIDSSKIVNHCLKEDNLISNFKLDLSRNQIDFLEKNIYDIVKFYQDLHLFFPTDNRVSVCVKKENVENFSISYDYNKIIVFLEDSNELLFYQTDLTSDEYRYKQFSGKYRMWISMIENQNMVYMEKHNYSKGVCKITKEKYGTVTWLEISSKEEDVNVPLYSSNLRINMDHTYSSIDFKPVHFQNVEQESIINFDLLNTLIYYKSITNKFVDKMQHESHKHFYIEDCNILHEYNARIQFKSDCEWVCRDCSIHESINRFVHVGYISNMYNSINCKWCLQMILNTKMKSLEECPEVSRHVAFLCQEILINYIRNFYCFPSDYRIENVRMDIIRNKDDIRSEENNLIHAFLKISSIPSVFKFKEGIAYLINEGDVIFMHSSKSFDITSNEDVFIFIRF
jgi:hypothetical protein